MAAINCTGSAEGALVPVLLRITQWPKRGLPVSPRGLFPPCFRPISSRAIANRKSCVIFLKGLSCTSYPRTEFYRAVLFICSYHEHWFPSCSSPFLDTDELKMALWARKVSGAFEKRAAGLQSKLPAAV